MKYAILGMAAFLASLSVYGQTTAGRPERSSDFDALPGFVNPPEGYGEVPFYWWMGDTLTREHLTAHLDMLENKGISSLQVNYAHSDKGGHLWGLTFPSEPDIFTEEWWELFGWFVKSANERGMTVSLSDYTLGAGQGKYVDEILREHPEINGYNIRQSKYENVGTSCIPMPANTIIAQAFKDDDIKGSLTDISSYCISDTLRWTAPSEGWNISVIYAEKAIPSYNPMHPMSGKLYIDYFFQRFEDRFGSGLNFFFSDELNFLLGNLMWDEYFRDEFIKIKGYDIVPNLIWLFEEGTDMTAAYRLDYNDVMVTLSERHFFEPVYRWHEDRGLIYGCDHGGRGRDVAEFGDYFRTQRWNQGPGCDQPFLSKNVIKNKVAASIAHMYERPRVWLEGFHSSGWDTSSEKLLDAIFANYVQGQNLLSLHGLYYSTPGGWWEWAPPCNHFRMPYWEEMDVLLGCVERLSFLLSQGTHCADVAILYPVEPVIAGNGKGAPECAFSLGKELYYDGIDFDFMDYQSLARAEIKDSKLCVASEEFSVLVIPDMKTIYSSSIEKAIEFRRKGGIVICVGELPEFTEKGRVSNREIRGMHKFENMDRSDVSAFISSKITPDFKAYSDKEDICIMHRKIGKRDIYAVYGAEKGTECFFRCHGKAELWDPWTGKVHTLPVDDIDENGTYIEMPLDDKEIQLIVFSEGEPSKARICNHADTTVIAFNKGWKCSPIPVLDNKWGDYHWPASEEKVGPEIRYIYSDTTRLTLGYGTFMNIIPALPDEIDTETLLMSTDSLPWEPYRFSWRWGVENDYGHQGYHGLKTEMYDNFIRLGRTKEDYTELQRIADPNGQHYYLMTDIIAPEAGTYTILKGDKVPDNIWSNGKEINDSADSIFLKKGANRIILHYIGHGNTYFAVKSDRVQKCVPEVAKEFPLSMKWNGDLSILRMMPVYGYTGQYHITTTPGADSLEVYVFASPEDIRFSGKEGTITPESANICRSDSLYRYIIPCSGQAKIGISIDNPQYPDASAFPYYIKQHCSEGDINIGDWSTIPGLECYSGGMWYRNDIEVPELQEGKTILSLGNVVSTAEVFVNGIQVGLRMTSPWNFDLTDYIKEGNNEISIRVYNTASPHYNTIPTRYRGETVSGILGPVRILRINED